MTIGLLLWRRRSPRVLPGLLLGPVALLQEGVGLIIGLVDYPDVASDWVHVMEAGVPPVAVAAVALLALACCFLWVQLVMPLLGLGAQDARWRLLLVLPAGIPMLLLAAVIYELAGLEQRAHWERAAEPHHGAGCLSGVRRVHRRGVRPLFPVLDRIGHTSPARVSPRDAVPAMVLGLAVLIAQIVFFN